MAAAPRGVVEWGAVYIWPEGDERSQGTLGDGMWWGGQCIDYQCVLGSGGIGGTVGRVATGFPKE